jgi:hypothetical protein
MLDVVIEHPLRWLPALALAALGATLAVRGVRWAGAGRTTTTPPITCATSEASDSS